MNSFTPSREILQRYAKVLVNFALNSGEGVKPGEVVRITINETAKPMYVELRNQLIRSKAHYITNYLPDDVSREVYELADEEFLSFEPKKYLKGMADTIDHSITIIADTDLHELEGIDPKKIMIRQKAIRSIKKWLNKKENEGKYTWTLALYGTPAMAREANMSLEEYWDQIIKACFLDETDPIAKWKEVTRKNDEIKNNLNALKIENLHVVGEGVNLKIKIGPNRKWLGGSGRNIPSFEVFISPDWRGTEGFIEFNQPLYRYGSLIEGIRLEFKDGRVVKSSASKNYEVLKAMINTKDADKVGEFSLTDKRLSRIDRFMAETLFDENISGPFGNTHIALGSAYQDSYDGDPSMIKPAQWKEMGFNDSSVHTDMISTTKRTVTATLSDGTEKVIYVDGEFVI